MARQAEPLRRKGFGGSSLAQTLRVFRSRDLQLASGREIALMRSILNKHEP